MRRGVGMWLMSDSWEGMNWLRYLAEGGAAKR